MTMPTWVEPVTLENWRTRSVEDDTMRCALAIHEAWAQNPQERTTNREVEHHYTGRNPRENLSINMMHNADPASDITNWVNVFLRMVGFPVMAMAMDRTNPPQLLNWAEVTAPEALIDRLDVDELRLFDGMGRIPDLIHIYMLLARRDTTAWKVTLTFDSACPPGTVAEIVERNDHVRAGATFGELKFL